ncbi:MAG: hypothetical protein Q4G60_01235 [bacterium]|nr:hypothetical protein [bacterium]
MTFQDYLQHYLSTPEIIYFVLVSLGVNIVIHFILITAAKIKSGAFEKKHRKKIIADSYEEYSESFYELVFSCTSILLFISIYFWLDLDYFDLEREAREIWQKYQDILLLGFIILSAVLNSIVDRILVPIRKISDEKRSTLRMMGMLYMMIIFLYIKFIYEDNNYDTILFYFLTLMIGRFVYFDASVKEFGQSMKRLLFSVPILLLELLTTAVVALYGFSTKYLLRSNGVVGSLFIAHFFLIVEIFILMRTGIFRRICGCKWKQNKKEAEDVWEAEEMEEIEE